MINRLYKIKINNYMKKRQKSNMDNEHPIVFEKDCWKINFNAHTYTISIFKQENEYYIRLAPYQQTYFQTRLTLKDVASQVHMILFAMEENEKLYRHD